MDFCGADDIEKLVCEVVVEAWCTGTGGRLEKLSVWIMLESSRAGVVCVCLAVAVGGCCGQEVALLRSTTAVQGKWDVTASGLRAGGCTREAGTGLASEHVRLYM